MASVRVHFSLGFPLGGGFPQSNLLQRGGKRPQEGPLRSTISEERGISRRAKCLVFAPGVFENMQSTSGNRFFAPAVFYSCRAPHGCNCSTGNPSPRGTPGLKRTRNTIYSLPQSHETIPLSTVIPSDAYLTNFSHDNIPFKYCTNLDLL
jgi:hypothetical protein